MYLPDSIGCDSSTPVNRRKRGDKKDLLSRSHKKTWYNKTLRSSWFCICNFLLYCCFCCGCMFSLLLIFFFIPVYIACFLGCGTSVWFVQCLSVDFFFFFLSCDLTINLTVFFSHLSVACSSGLGYLFSVVALQNVKYIWSFLIVWDTYERSE